MISEGSVHVAWPQVLGQYMQHVTEEVVHLSADRKQTEGDRRGQGQATLNDLFPVTTSSS
jgi:hypothetical protein